MANKRPPQPERLEIATRIRELVERIGTQAEAARVAEVSERQLRMYIAGDSSPPFITVARLAKAAGADLNWVAALRVAEPVTNAYATASAVSGAIRQAETDAQLLGQLLEAIGRVYEMAGEPLSRHELGELAAEEYDRIVAATDDERERMAMVKLVAEKHRHGLGKKKGPGKMLP